MVEAELIKDLGMLLDLVDKFGKEDEIFSKKGAARLLWWLFRVNLDAFIHPVSRLKAEYKLGDYEKDLKYLIDLPKEPPDISKLLYDISKELTLANAISASRPMLVIAANITGIENPLEYMGLMTAAFSTDALDGWIARKQGKSPWGAWWDIAGDRAAETLMYFYLSGEGVAPGWVPAVILGRGIVTDIIRTSHMIIDRNLLTTTNALSPKEHLLDDLATSRIIRAGYGILKATVALSAPIIPSASQMLSEVAAGVCLIRGIPVIFNEKNKDIITAIGNTLQKQN